MVLFSHLLRRLGGRITIVAGREKAGLLVGAGIAERGLDFESLPMHELFSDVPLDKCRLPALLGRHDRLVSCFAGAGSPSRGGQAGSGAELRLAGACGAADAVFLPVRPPGGFRGHLLDLWADMLGLMDASVRPWRIPPAWRRAGRELLRGAGVDSGRPYVVIHPGSGSKEKCWPLERFLELGEMLGGSFSRGRSAIRVRHSSIGNRSPMRVCDSLRLALAAIAGIEVVLIVGPVEQEKWGADRIAAIRRRFPLLVSPPLAATAGLLAGASGYVGNDSGVSHLAAAMGSPSMALFGPTRAKHFAPVGPAVRIVESQSLADLPVELVLAKVRHHLLPER